MANKYGNARIKRKGKRFDSGIEMLRYDYLLKQEKKGIISDLHRQVIFDLVPTVYVSPSGKTLSLRKQSREWRLAEWFEARLKAADNRIFDLWVAFLRKRTFRYAIPNPVLNHE